jgi:hypothetical protein
MTTMYPVKSYNEYKINNKKIIIIGEMHQILNKPKTNKSSIEVSEYFINKVKNENYIGALELNFGFHNYVDNIIKTLQGPNMKNILSKAKKEKILHNIHGIDFRRREDFFGMLGDATIQSYFFALNKNLMYVNFGNFLKMVDNMMMFVNKVFYNEQKKLLESINPDMLKDLYNLHRKVDTHNGIFKTMVKEGMLFIDMIPITKKHNVNFGVILREYREFIVLFSDILTLVDIMFKPKNVILLIGDAHAQNYKKYLNKHNINPKIKNFGNEISENVVYLG